MCDHKPNFLSKFFHKTIEIRIFRNSLKLYAQQGGAMPRNKLNILTPL